VTWPPFGRRRCQSIMLHPPTTTQRLGHKCRKEKKDCDHLRYLLAGLCVNADDNDILEKLCAAAIAFDDDMLLFKEDEYDWEVQFEPKRTVVAHANTPKSFSEIAATVGAITWDGGGPEVGYAIDDQGMSTADAWLFEELRHDSPEECERVEAAGKPRASFLAGQNGLFFDPLKKQSNGEPGLAFISHEGGGWVSVDSVRDLDYGQILLRMLSDAMTGSNLIPELYF
jgi:hypothetical protein